MTVIETLEKRIKEAQQDLEKAKIRYEKYNEKEDLSWSSMLSQSQVYAEVRYYEGLIRGYERALDLL